MSVRTEVVSKAEWDAARMALLAKEETRQGAPAGLPQDRVGSWTRRSDEYTPKQLVGGRS